MMTRSTLLEKQVGIRGHHSRFSGIGGTIKHSPQDFIVREIIPSGEILTTGKEIGEDIGGMFVHFVLWKQGMDTHSALKRIGKLCHHNDKDFGYAGLKDAQAETLQRISVWSGNKECLGNINFPKLKILNPIRQKFSVSIGDLVGNRFQVNIRNIIRKMNHFELKTLCSEAESTGFLNFYGLQRFGSKRPILHKFGRFLLQEKYSLAVDSYLGEYSEFEHEKISRLRQMYAKEDSLSEIYEQYPSTYSFEKRMLSGLMKGFSKEKIIKSFPIYFLRLAISAYQSYLFNKTLNAHHEQCLELSPQLRLPIIGYSTDLSTFPREIRSLILDFLSQDDLDLNSFNHQIKKLCSKGTERSAVLKPSDIKVISHSEKRNILQIRFSLLKGSYGTMFLREVLKNDSFIQN
ncbi:MAG: tRNA pseudouridine(13) synthase TruD [Candidatus Hodarchaeales archaeon]|jgi:tRNA pseudouridine13 synthase